MGGHKTSVSIEDEFWLSLKQIASERQSTLAKLVQEVDAARDRGNLSSAIRVYVLRHYRQRCGLDGENGASDRSSADPS